MNTLVLALSLLKIGMYAPAGSGSLGVAPYLAVGLHDEEEHPWGVEFGFTEEARRVSYDALGLSGSRVHYYPTAFLGVTKGITKHDLDLAVGTKLTYINGIYDPSPYIGVSLRLSALIWGPQK